MSTAPPGGQTRPLFYRTVIAHFEGPDGETPLGVRVVEPAPESRQALRGNLYAIVDLVGENPGRTHLAESLLSAIQRTYFTRAGSQSQVLTEAVRQARLRVSEFNQSHPDQPVQLGVICAGLVRSRLMITHSGPAFAFITADDQVARYPSEIVRFKPFSTASVLSPSDSDIPDDHPSGNPVNWEIYSQDLREHTALFLGTPRWLDVVPVRTIAGTVAHINAENCGDAASGLLATSRRPDLPGLLLVVDQVDAPPVEPVSQAAPPRRSPLLGAAGLTGAVNARPPVVNVPDVESDSSSSSAVEESPVDDLPENAELISDEASGVVPSDVAPAVAAVERLEESRQADEAASVQTNVDRNSDDTVDDMVDDMVDDVGGDVYTEGFEREAAMDVVGLGVAGGDVVEAEAVPSGPSTLSKISTGLLAGAIVGLDRTREIISGMFPERRLPDDGSAVAVYDDGARADDGYGDDDVWDDGLADEALVAGTVAMRTTVGPDPDAMAAVPGGGTVDVPSDGRPSFYQDVSTRVSAALNENDAPFVPPEPASGGRARLFITLAVLILILVPVVVAAVYQQWGQDPDVSAQGYAEMAETFLANAQTSLDNGDTDSARSMFLKASESLNDAVALTGHTPQSDQLFDEINSGLDEVMQTRYLYQLADPLISFSDGDEPFRVMAVGENLFVMDRARQTVERYELDALGEYVPDPEPELIMQEGARVDGATISGMVDMAWQPIVAGYEDRAKLLVLDRDGQIFSYDLRVDGVQPIEMEDPALLQNASQIEVFLGRTYIADEGQNQIFRYGLGDLGGTPIGWFPEETRPFISGLLAMAIDGDIWMLNSEGTLVRYFDGEQVPFSLDSGAVRADEPVDMAMGSQGDSSIFIADAADDRILAFDKEGTYKYQLVASEGEPLKDLQGLYLDEFDDKIYILTKTALYQHPLPE